MLRKVGPAPDEQHLWLSQHVLSATWNRVVRDSHAHHKTGRRYASNVPGPLEAHRRSSRRRMGMSAGVHAGDADFAALFGFGGYGGRPFDPQRDLRWKPPGVEKVKKAEHWMFPKIAKRKEDIFESCLPPIEEEVNAVEVSRAAFDMLLASKTITSVEMKHFDDILAFLESTQDEPAANNVLRLCVWLAERQASKQTSRALAALVASKIRLQTMSWQHLSEILACLANMEERGIPTITRILDTIPRDRVQAICASTIRKLFRQCSPNTEPSSALLMWLFCMRRCAVFRHEHLGDEGRLVKTSKLKPRSSLLKKTDLMGSHLVNSFHKVHQLLAIRFRDPAMLAPHLSTFSRSDLCEILRRHWLPLLPAVNRCITPYHGIKRLRFGHLRDRVTAVRVDYIAMRKDRLKAVQADYIAMREATTRAAGQAMREATREAITEATTESTKKSRAIRARRGVFSHQTCVIALLHATQKNGIQHDMLARGIFTILQHRHSDGATALFKIFLELQRHPTLGVPESLPESLIRYFLDCGNEAGDKFARLVFASSPAAPLKLFPDLALRLARDENLPSAAIWPILHRQTAEEVVPKRERTQVKNSLLPERVDLMHLIALNIAKANNISPRVAFRRTWECYRFLQDRGAPVTSLMTRALVTAGITRYLQDYTRPPKTQVRYILRIVQEIEGTEVAEELDRTIYTVWKGKVFPAIIQKWRERSKGEHLQQAFEELKQAKYKPTKQWALPKPQELEHDGTKHGQWAFAQQKCLESTAIEAAPLSYSSCKFEPHKLPLPESYGQNADAAIPLPKQADSPPTSANITADAISSADAVSSLDTTSPPPLSETAHPVPRSTSTSTLKAVVRRDGLGYNTSAFLAPSNYKPTSASSPAKHCEHMHTSVVRDPSESPYLE